MEELEINKIDLNTKEGQEELSQKLKELKDNPNINKPSEEECKQFKKEFEELSLIFGTARWNVGEPEEGEEILNYIRHFSRERYLWKSNEWMGVIKLQEELDFVEKDYNKNAKQTSINFSYPALEFIYQMFKSPGGIGYEAALNFELENEIYGNAFDKTAASLKESREALRDVEFAQQKWQAAEQGFYLEKDEPIKEGEDNFYYDEELGKNVSVNDPEFSIEKFQEKMKEKYNKELSELPEPTDHLEEENE